MTETRPPMVLNTVLNKGFRTFFLLAGLSGAGFGLAWTMMWSGWTPNLGFDARLWHAHEMVFGYTLAAITGFFLTVVPNWTGCKAAPAPVIALLAAAWMIGRLALWPGLVLPPLLVAVCDMLFVPALLLVVGKPLLDPRYRRQVVFVPILVLILLGNALVHLDSLGVVWADASMGLLLGLDAILVLISVMGGRVTPSFTSSALGHMDATAKKVIMRPWLEKILLPGMFLLAAVNAAALVWPQMWPVAGGLGVALAALHALRLSGWQGHRTLPSPILWVLHLGYGWLVIGLALRGLAAFDIGLSASDVMHALTIGTIGTMTLGIMTRASLGHTGRSVRASRPIVVAYVLVSLAALARLGVPFADEHGVALIQVSGMLWSAAFALFVLIYTPVLISPRVDGRPG